MRFASITSLFLCLSSLITLTRPTGDDFENAESLFRERKFTEAEPLYDRIAAANPNYAQAQLRLGTIYYASGHPAQAEKCLREHLKLHESAEAYSLLAGIQLNQEKFEQAIESAKRALGLNKSYARAYTALGMIYTVLQDWPNAESSFRDALQLDDKDSSTWFLLGRSFYLRNQLSKAKEAFEAALRLNPQGVEIYQNLALTLDRMGDPTTAEKLFKQGAEMNALRTPPDKRIHIAYGTFLFGLNRVEQSCEQFKAAINAAPKEPDGYFELAKALFHIKRLSEAAQEGEAALQVGGPDYRIHYLLSRIYTALGDEHAASQHAERAASLSDKQP